MSHASSSYDGGHGWPCYGPVPLTRCPECERLEPLVRLRSKRSENGNFGQEFVKCESKPHLGKALRKCNFFMWLDDYINMIEGAKLTGGQEKMMASKFGVDVTANSDVLAELKKMNDNMCKIIDLKMKHNYMLGVFYVVMIFIALLFAASYGSKHL